MIHHDRLGSYLHAFSSGSVVCIFTHQHLPAFMLGHTAFMLGHLGVAWKHLSHSPRPLEAFTFVLACLASSTQAVQVIPGGIDITAPITGADNNQPVFLRRNMA